MRTCNLSRNWTVAAAVAAMIAASTSGVRAQNTMTPPAAPANGNMAAAPMAANAMPGMMATGVIDYTPLSNTLYNYSDLQMAKNRGFSDSQIATIAKISKETYIPFSVVSAAVERGETFPTLATQYGLNLGDVYENDKEKTEIANYNTAYESLNEKKPMMGGAMAPAMPMMGGAMAPAMPMMGGAMAPAMPMATLDIVDTAMAAKNLTTLVKALQVAGLVETLRGAGPFTVFAPDDNAFAKLPAGTLDALLADPVKLKSILTYHVIPASVDAAAAMSMTSPTSPPTVQGATLQVTKGRRGKLMINDATVIKADIHATNGIIHIIDKVLMPPMDAAAPPM